MYRQTLQAGYVDLQNMIGFVLFSMQNIENELYIWVCEYSLTIIFIYRYEHPKWAG